MFMCDTNKTLEFFNFLEWLKKEYNIKDNDLITFYCKLYSKDKGITINKLFNKYLIKKSIQNKEKYINNRLKNMEKDFK